MRDVGDVLGVGQRDDLVGMPIDCDADVRPQVGQRDARSEIIDRDVESTDVERLLRPALPGGCRLAGFRALVFRRLPQILLLTTRLLFNALLFIREIFIIALLAVAHRRFSLSSKR